MSATVARARINVGTVSVELEGPTDFVDAQLKELRDRLLPSGLDIFGKAALVLQSESPSLRYDQESEPQTKGLKSDEEVHRFFGVSRDDLANVVQFQDGGFFIVGNVQGGSLQRSIEQYCLLHCLVNEFLGYETTTKALRESCAQAGFRADKFGTYLTRIADKGLLGLLGTAGSKDRPVRLTPKGREAAKTLVRSLVRQVQGG